MAFSHIYSVGENEAIDTVLPLILSPRFMYLFIDSSFTIVCTIYKDIKNSTTTEELCQPP